MGLIGPKVICQMSRAREYRGKIGGIPEKVNQPSHRKFDRCVSFAMKRYFVVVQDSLILVFSTNAFLRFFYALSD